jgi:hypothetical protein
MRRTSHAQSLDNAHSWSPHMADKEREETTVVPLPGTESEEEHRRIRSSNDRDQKLEREGKESKHNRGYDEAADGAAAGTEIERVIDED